MATGGAAGMIPFVARAFGGAAQEARRGGADLSGQLLYGSAQAAKEYVTEKLFGLTLPQKLMGPGAAGGVDGLLETGIRNVTERLAKSPGGQKVLGGLATWMAAGATEGLEEIIGAGIENALITPNLNTWAPDTRTTQQKVDDALYDGLVGFVSGVIGGAPSALTYQPSAPRPMSPAAPHPAAEAAPSVPAAPAPATAPAEGTMAAALVKEGAPAEEAEVLAPALETLLSGGEISGNQAGSIAHSEAALSLLEQATGVHIDTDAPLGEVKATIKGLASRQQAAEEAPAAVDALGETLPAETQQEPQDLFELPEQLGDAPEMLRGRAAVEDFAQSVDKAGATVLTSMYADGQDEENYVSGMMKAYSAGRKGEAPLPPAVFQDLYGINESQAQAAYLAGQADGGSPRLQKIHTQTILRTVRAAWALWRYVWTAMTRRSRMVSDGVSSGGTEAFSFVPHVLTAPAGM